VLGRTPPAAPDDRIEFAPLDLTGAEPPQRSALEGCTAIVHLAAYVPQDQGDPAATELCLRTNALGTLRLLTAMERAGIRRMVQTTSANAYSPDEDFPSESSPMYPAQRAPFYLASKIVQDILGSHWELRRNIAVTTLRLSSVYGAGLEKSLFTRFCEALAAGQPVRLASGGSFGADFVELSDVSSAIRMAFETGVTGPLNIASGRRTTLLEAMRLLLDITGVPGDRLIVEPSERHESGFPAIDISKAVTLGYKPTDLRTGLQGLVDWVAGKPKPAES
jgi:UDP-glucose 4-epimerase